MRNAALWSVAMTLLIPMGPRLPIELPGRPVVERGQATGQPLPAGESFVCPMHPDVRTATPGTCPKCGMSLVTASSTASGAYVLQTETIPAPVRAGQSSRLKLWIRHPATNGVIRRFVDVHEKPFHLFVVSHDLKQFDHIHPVLAPDGSLEVDYAFPRAGAYQLYADFLPEGGAPQLLQQSLLTAGYAGDPEEARARLEPDLADKTDRGMVVKLQLSEGQALVAGRQELFRLRLSDARSGEPVTDLQPFLGASGHALILSEDLVDAIHSHPVVEFSRLNGPDVVFEAMFPRPGLYRLWAQFKRNGEVSTVAFTLPVTRQP